MQRETFILYTDVDGFERIKTDDERVDLGSGESSDDAVAGDQSTDSYE